MERRMRVKCPKCGKEGTLTKRLTISDGKRYFYYYVQHVQTVEGKTKRTWHYYGKPEDTIHKNIENYTQRNNKDKNLNSKPNSQKESEKERARSSARLERQAHNLLVAGSNPAGPIL
jgi:hypothetical protein